MTHSHRLALRAWLSLAALSWHLVPSALALTPITTLPESLLHLLNETVNGRLYEGIPLALPCFQRYGNAAVLPNEAECNAIEAGYTTSTFRASAFGAFMESEWETCQATQQQCLLDSFDPSDPTAFDNTTCYQGSIAPYYIDVREAQDIQAAFAFAKRTGVPLSIKNSGHDYKGRSSIPNSLALWVHNLNSTSYDANFVPEGCKGQSYSAVTAGTGASWQQVYDLADELNITVIGGYHQTVAASGGWLMGGGHSVLSPVYGLGVDRVLQYKIVTPDGQLRTANECQNSDLFWALRGGGGGTFGVVLEATHKAEKQLTIQAAVMTFNPTLSNLPEYYSILVNNSLRWGDEGWGGHVVLNTLIYVNPLLNVSEAEQSMEPLADYVRAQNGTVIIETLPSWKAFFTKYVLAAEAAVGTPLAISSRLIPKSNFETDAGRTVMAGLLLDSLEYGIPYVTVVPPILYNATEGATSVTPAWRSALWHFIVVNGWQFNATKAEITSTYAGLQNCTETLRAVAPESGSYFNEGDVYEPDHENSYWGQNYPRLLAVKQKYDPNHLLDCWQCVGWRGESDSRYSCFMPTPAL